MNGEIPSVPITTLAGISSLTDLLPEMPLPSPLPQTMSNKSLLFHPRVAEEANILLSLRDDALVPQLTRSLNQTAAVNIELKDHYSSDHVNVDQQNIPELLKAILCLDPEVFNGYSGGTKGPVTEWSVNSSEANKTSVIYQAEKSVTNQEGETGSNPALHSHHFPNTPPTLLKVAPPPPAHVHPHLQLHLQNQPLVHIHHSHVVPQSHTHQAVPYTQTQTDIHTEVSQGHSERKNQVHSNNESMHSLPQVAPINSQVNCIGGSPASVVGIVGPPGSTTENKFPERVNTTTLTSSAPRPLAHPTPGASPEQASMAPVSQVCGAPTVVVPSAMLNARPSVTPCREVFASGPNTTPVEQKEPVAIDIKTNDTVSPSSICKDNKDLKINEKNTNKERKVEDNVGNAEPKELAAPSPNLRVSRPVVMLNRLTTEDQVLMQKSLKAFAEKSPSLANKLGITNKLEEVESDSDEEPKNKSKYFKAREKERELQRKKEKVSLKASEDDKSSEKYDRSKRRKKSTRSSESLDRSKEEEKPNEQDLPKPKLRKVERRIIPTAEKLSVEELMETNTYQRFNRSMEKIFEDVEDVDIMAEIGDEGDCPCEALIPKYQLQDLCGEAAKLNTLGAMDSIPTDKATRLLTILERNIRDGAKVCPISDPNDGEDERKLFVELAMERVMRAVDASLTALYILTSPNMHKQIYLEDVIDRIIVFTKFQLHNTIYPAFDPVYRLQAKDKDGYVGSGRKKRAHCKDVRDKSVLTLYTKLTEVVSFLGELMDIQRLTDNSVLHASSMGVSPFFVEGVSDLQLAALKLVTTIFAKYEKHRKLLLDDILASMARLPSSKRSLRSYRLSSEEHIQMLTALVLQLVQCMVVLPQNLVNKQVDADVIIVSKFKAARTTASNFLYVFLTKCSSKSEEIDYRPLFENFVQDLLTTVNKPEWPAAELMLSVLGNLLVNNFVNKSLEMSLRVASLDYLGVVAARLRKDTVVSQLKRSTIDQIIKDIQLEESKDDEGISRGEIKDITSDEERTQFLQRVLLDYLAMRGQTEAVLGHARHFYLAQWYQDYCSGASSPSSTKKHQRRKKKTRKKGDTSSESSDDVSTTEDEGIHSKSSEDPMETYRSAENKKKFLLSKIRPFEETVASDGSKTQILQTYVDYSSAELIARYLASKRPFSQSFDVYLKHILKVLTETSVLIRTKAMKCLTSIVEVDPGVLGLKEMQLGVSHSFLDHSTSVREAAVDLVGKFILSRPELISTYYDMLSARILDTGVSVRKRVIKILKDVCVECPDFDKIPEICVKIIRRVNDEDGIRKLVLEVFQNMWFTPVRERPVLDSDALVRKVMNITDVVAASNDVSIEWFEQLLLSLFKPREDKDEPAVKASVEVPRSILTACRQIVDCLVETVLRLDGSGGGDNSQRLVSCLTMLYLFAKIRPQLLVHHATTLQPYLSLKCQTQGDYQMISCVARTLELVVPLIEHPSEMFLSRLEEDSVKLMMQQDPSVVLSCVSCLGSIVNNVTRNFALIRDCLKKYHGFLTSYRLMLETNVNSSLEMHQKLRPSFRRSLFVVGLLLRFFDFTDKEVIGDLPETIKDDVFNTFIYFLKHEEDSQHYTLKAIGSVCIRHYDLMLGIELKSLYHRYLTDENAPLQMKVQVLNNIENYLQEEERKMIKQDQEWAKLSKTENLKEMGDVTSGMASTVIQLYLKETLEAFLHPHPSVRNSALRVIQLILAQGLVHPVQIVPYLICMSTDEDKAVSSSADKQLQDIEKKYPGFIHMKAQYGIQLSYKLQRIIQYNVDVVRGFRVKEGEFLPSALNGFLYSILRTKQQRRALVLSILKQFEDQVKTSLSQMLYLADNMAYFPYQVQDEPLFIIHHIDIIISVTGTNLLQSFREALIPTECHDKESMPRPEDEEEDEDEDSLLRRMPEDTKVLQHCLTASQGCLLLLVLKQHLKTLYGFNDAKITQYSPTESAKVYEKSVNRKSNSKFNPKATLQKLKQGSPPNVLDEEARRSLVSEYLEFKTLIMNLDPDDEDDTDDGAPRNQSEGSVLRVRELIAKKEQSEQASQQQSDSPPKVPKLTIVTHKGEVRQVRTSHRTRKAERHKKHHKRKRKLRSSDDSEADFSDPDFLV
ncbi:nipped-B cohesin loading factor [Rhodnius prolixus]|uniref:nipped-B cohesin loading factor n=1 Tax=Rhodnius prolixus TaxID=13249 RepID=UPI003D18AFDB